MGNAVGIIQFLRKPQLQDSQCARAQGTSEYKLQYTINAIVYMLGKLPAHSQVSVLPIGTPGPAIQAILPPPLLSHPSHGFKFLKWI